MERGLGMAQRLDLQVRNRCPRHVGDTHAEHQGVHEVANHDVLAVHGLVLGEPHVGVQWVVVHGDHAKEVVVGLGDGLARPVPVHVPDVEILIVAPEGPVDDGHGSPFVVVGGSGPTLGPGPTGGQHRGGHPGSR